MNTCDHCFCETLTVNEKEHVKCCNCGYQVMVAQLNARWVRSLAEGQSYQIGSGESVRQAARYVIDCTRRSVVERTLPADNTWQDRYNAQ